MSFGYSLSDFALTAKLARATWKQFEDAPGQYKAIRTEVANLNLVLDDVVQCRSELQVSEEQKEKLDALVEGCKDVLAELRAKLKKSECLDDTSQSLKTKSRKAWSRLRWDQTEIQGLRDRIVSNATLLDSFSSSLVISGIDRRLEGIEQNQISQEHKNIARWLSSLEPFATQEDVFCRWQEGTGQWLLDSPEFKGWLCGERKTLWCHGRPGAGKTVIASVVIDHVQRAFKDDNAVILWIYCNYKQKSEQTITNLLGSLLKQVVLQRPNISDHVRGLHDKHSKLNTRPAPEEIVQVLGAELACYSQTFIVVDALDECSEESKTRSNLLGNLRSLSGNVSLLVTSRNLPTSETECDFDRKNRVEIRASDEDVRCYVEARISSEPRLLRHVKVEPTLRNLITETIVNNVEGMFLLAQLHMDSLETKTKRKAIHDGLRHLPKSIDDTYDEAMARIDQQNEDLEDLANNVLLWISCARRPLSLMELQHALAVEEGQTSIDSGDLDDEETLISVCVGLVVLDEISNTVRLVHYTTQDYFERIRPQRFSNYQSRIATTCLTYLLFDVFAGGPCLSNDAVDARLNENALFGYASQNWGHHVKADTKRSVKALITEFLKDEVKVQSSVEVLFWNASSGKDDRIGWNVRYADSLHLAVFFSLEDTTVWLIGEGVELNPRDSEGRTPLSWGVLKADQALVGLLVTKGAELESKDNHGRTPLSLAASFGEVEMVRLLLEKGAELESKDTGGLTALSWAARKGKEAVVRLLLENGAELESRGNFGQTPLSQAAWIGEEAVAQLLLEKGAELESRDGYGQMPLSQAAMSGEEAMVRLLLKKGAELESKDGLGLTALSWAAKKGQEAVVRLLLEKGAELESQDERGQTALSWAAEMGRGAVVRLLLEKGAELDSKDGHGQTPLSSAAENGQEAVVRLLLEKGAELESKDGCGQTPLSWAAMSGEEVVVRLLLEKGAELESKDGYGQTPLSWAVISGKEAVVRLLLEKGAELESKDGSGQTPLLGAAMFGKEAVVRLLLEKGAKLESKDGYGQTPLSWAAMSGEEAVVRLLLEKGAKLESKDDSGRTPLSHAAEKGREAVVRLLLEKGAELESKDDSGRTPLSHAAEKGREAVVRLLLEKGAELESKDTSGLTALSWAGRKGQEAVVRLLLERGAVTSSGGSNGIKPSTFAAEGGTRPPHGS
ncbi:MAG: hypothetical protein M1824_006491 [Vezdaea acicularis]|nr:MAG: hypothetical protein M1824_006491 [Vezdaea acicularis]